MNADRSLKTPDYTAKSYCSVQYSVVQVSSLLMLWMLNSFCYVSFIRLVRSSFQHWLWRIVHTITAPYCDELWKITVKYGAWTIGNLFTFNEWKRNFNRICPHLGHINNLDMRLWREDIDTLPTPSVLPGSDSTQEFLLFICSRLECLLERFSQSTKQLGSESFIMERGERERERVIVGDV